MTDAHQVSTLSPTRQTRTRESVERQGMSYAVAADPRSFSALLGTMRERSMLTTRMLAAKLGVAPASINQYFYRKRGAGGSSTIKWFLRYAEACGCKVYITFPGENDAKRVDADGVVAPAPLIGVGQHDE